MGEWVLSPPPLPHLSPCGAPGRGFERTGLALLARPPPVLAVGMGVHGRSMARLGGRAKRERVFFFFFFLLRRLRQQMLAAALFWHARPRPEMPPIQPRPRIPPNPLSLPARSIAGLRPRLRGGVVVAKGGAAQPGRARPGGHWGRRELSLSGTRAPWARFVHRGGLVRLPFTALGKREREGCRCPGGWI